MEIIDQSLGELLGWHFLDDTREWVKKNKPREMKRKLMTSKEGTGWFVDEGDDKRNSR